MVARGVCHRARITRDPLALPPCIRIDQRALGDQRIDFSIGKAGLAQNLLAVLAKVRPRIMVAQGPIMTPVRSMTLTPARGPAGVALFPFTAPSVDGSRPRPR